MGGLMQETAPTSARTLKLSVDAATIYFFDDTVKTNGNRPFGNGMGCCREGKRLITHRDHLLII
jgi:hypothetical protein